MSARTLGDDLRAAAAAARAAGGRRRRAAAHLRASSTAPPTGSRPACAQSASSAATASPSCSPTALECRDRDLRRPARRARRSRRSTRRPRTSKLAYLLDRLGRGGRCLRRRARSRRHARRRERAAGDVRVVGDVAVVADGRRRRPAQAALTVDLAGDHLHLGLDRACRRASTFTHRNMTFVADSIIEYLGLRASDRILCVLPLSLTYGLYQLLICVRARGDARARAGLRVPGPGRRSCSSDERITVLPGVPTVWQVLLSLRGLGRARAAATCACSPTPAPRCRSRRSPRCARRFPNARAVLDVRADRVQARLLPAARAARRAPGSVGIAIPGTEVWIEDEDGERSPARRGRRADRPRRPRHAGLLERPRGDGGAAAARPLALGARPALPATSSGTTRRATCTSSAAATTSSSRAARRSPPRRSRRCSTCPRASARPRSSASRTSCSARRSSPTSRPEPARSSTPTSLRRHCAERLEDYMVPKRVVVHDELPRTDNGKLDRATLREH